MIELLERRKFFREFMHNAPTDKNFKPKEIPLVFDFSELDVARLKSRGIDKTITGLPLKGMLRYFFCSWGKGSCVDSFGLVTQKEFENAVDEDRIKLDTCHLHGNRIHSNRIQFPHFIMPIGVGISTNFGFGIFHEVKDIKINIDTPSL